MEVVASFSLLRSNGGRNRVVEEGQYFMKNGPRARSSRTCFAAGRQARRHARSGFRSEYNICFAFAVSTLSLGHERRWWSIHKTPTEQAGFWETEVVHWHGVVAAYWRDRRESASDYLDMKYLSNFRLDYATWLYLKDLLCPLLERQSTAYRLPICPEKRLAIVLYYLAHGLTFVTLASTFRIGVSTAHQIVHESIPTMKEVLMPKTIRFPSGMELQRVMGAFEHRYGLPLCAGALDGTFVKMKKPNQWGDTYWCYKNYVAILLLAVCDDKAQFTYVDVGRAGAVGDAFAYNNSSLKTRIEGGVWLQEFSQEINDTVVHPFIIADSAFALSPQLMKNYDHPVHQHELNFNRKLTSARQKIENAFGFLKGRWHILTNNAICDPKFVRDIALVCCALHNVCQRSQCPYDQAWTVQPANYNLPGPAPVAPAADAGNEVRFAVAQAV